LADLAGAIAATMEEWEQASRKLDALGADA
jgi:hypothetical protein